MNKNSKVFIRTNSNLGIPTQGQCYSTNNLVYTPTSEYSNIIKIINNKEIEELEAISSEPNILNNIDDNIYQLPSTNLELCTPVKMSLLTKEYITNITSNHPENIIIFSILANSKLCKIIAIDSVTTLSINSCKIYIQEYIPKSLEWTHTNKTDTSLKILISHNSKLTFKNIYELRQTNNTLICGHNSLSKTIVDIQTSTTTITKSSLKKARYLQNIFTNIPKYKIRKTRDLVNLFTDTASPEDINNLVKQENSNIKTFNDNFGKIHETEQNLIKYVTHQNNRFINRNEKQDLDGEVNNLLHNGQLASLTLNLINNKIKLLEKDQTYSNIISMYNKISHHETVILNDQTHKITHHQPLSLNNSGFVHTISIKLKTKMQLEIHCDPQMKNENWTINSLHNQTFPITNHTFTIDNKTLPVTQEINISPKNYTKYSISNTTLKLSYNNLQNHVICMEQKPITLDNTTFICTRGLQYPFQKSANSSEEFFTAMSMAINSKPLKTQTINYKDPSIYENINNQNENTKLTLALLNKLHFLAYYYLSPIVITIITIACSIALVLIYKKYCQNTKKQITTVEYRKNKEKVYLKPLLKSPKHSTTPTESKRPKSISKTDRSSIISVETHHPGTPRPLPQINWKNWLNNPDHESQRKELQKVTSLMDLETNELHLKSIRFLLEAKQSKTDNYILKEFSKLNPLELQRLYDHIINWEKTMKSYLKIETTKINKDTENIEAIKKIMTKLTHAVEGFEKIRTTINESINT